MVLCVLGGDRVGIRKRSNLNEEEAIVPMKKKIEDLQVDIEQTSDMIVRIQEEQNKNLEERNQITHQLKARQTELDEIKKQHDTLSKEHIGLLNNYERDKKLLKNLKSDAEETKKFIMNEIESLKKQKDIVIEEHKKLTDERESLKDMREELINLILIGKKAKVLNQDKRMNFENPLQLNQDLSSISLRKFKEILKTLKAEFEFASI